MPKESVYIDACAWIAHYKPTEKLTDEQRTSLTRLFDRVARGEVIAVGSTLIYIEVLTVSVKEIQSAFDGRRGLLVAADEAMTIKARELQQKCYDSGKKILSNFDAVHLATAAAMGCKKFITLDRVPKNGQLAPIDSRKMLERFLGLKILDPAEIDDQKVLDFSPPSGPEGP